MESDNLYAVQNSDPPPPDRPRKRRPPLPMPPAPAPANVVPIINMAPPSASSVRVNVKNGGSGLFSCCGGVILLTVLAVVVLIGGIVFVLPGVNQARDAIRKTEQQRLDKIKADKIKAQQTP